MCAVRPIDEVWIFSRTPGKVAAMISEFEAHEREQEPGKRAPQAGRLNNGSARCSAQLVAARTPREALTGADIVCATTTSKSPVFDDADLRHGVHINAVGSYTRDAREISRRNRPPCSGRCRQPRCGLAGSAHPYPYFLRAARNPRRATRRVSRPRQIVSQPGSPSDLCREKSAQAGYASHEVTDGIQRGRVFEHQPQHFSHSEGTSLRAGVSGACRATSRSCSSRTA